MSKLQLLLLGHFECLLPSGERISLSMRKAEVLLAYLALAPGIRHPRERLINLLWSDRGEEQARNSLRQCLSAIRKSLGDVADLVIQVDRTSVCLKPEMIDIDALEFERLASDGEFESLSDSAELYRGEFLEGISIRDAASQEWLDGERSRFKRQYIEILTNLGHTLLASHDYNGAIRTSECLVVQDTLGESGWRLLMRAYFANGDRSHALQAFKRCQQVLRSELEVEPEATTLELRDQITANQVQSSPMPVRDIAPASETTSSPATDNKGISEHASQTSSHNIAVLPFDNLSGDPEQEYFSDGITDSIILNLAMFPDLLVKSRNSSFAFKQQIKSPGEISAELNVDYLVEGSIRKSSDRIRITVQLIEAASGNQIWGKRYDADLSDLFTLEEELSRTIAATVTGQIESELQRIALAKGAAGQQAYDLLLSGIYHSYRFNRHDNVIAIEKLNQCLDQDSNNVRAQVYLYVCHEMDYLGRWTTDYKASFDLARSHIEKAIQLRPDLGLVQTFYAEYLMFSGKTTEANRHLDKALDINPNDTDALAIRAICLSIQGDFATSLQVAEDVYRMDPYHPWAEWELAGGQYHSGNYQTCLDTIAGFRTEPGFVWIIAIACHVKLGHIDKACQALQDFLQACREDMLQMPQTYEDWFQYIHATYPYDDDQYSRDFVDCLMQVGLEKLLDRPAKPAAETSHNIAVLPFDNLSGDPEQEYFSDGISESIILHLNCFPGLVVKSRNSSFAFKQQIKSLGEISEELGVDYLVEGSLRKSAEQIRITVQLVEAASGNQVWGKRYDAPLTDLFSLEEQLSRSIAATVTGQIESDLQRIALAKSASDQQAYDLLLAGIYHNQQYTREDTAIAIEKLEQCLQGDPGNATAHGWLYVSQLMNYLGRWTMDHRASFESAGKHIRKAWSLAPDNTLVQVFYTQYLAFCGEFDEARGHLNKLLSKYPDNPTVQTTMALVLELLGEGEEALRHAERACELDPYHPWAEWELAVSQFVAGQYGKVLDTIDNMRTTPGFIQIFGIAANIKLDREAPARALMQTMLDESRESMLSMPQDLNDWLEFTLENYPFADPQINQDIIDCLVQAGLRGETESISPGERPDDHNIAVLPFDNLSGDPAQEYFSDGITESILLNLSLFPGLNVKSRNSSFAFKQQIKSVGEISRELDVDYIVEGSIRKTDDRIRVAVQLVEASSGNQVWGKRYDADIVNLFDLEEELSRTIAATVTGQIESDLQRIALGKGAADQQAYDLLLAGRYHLDKGNAQDTQIAIEKLNQCLALDPVNALAHTALFWCHDMNVIDRWVEDIEQTRKLADEHIHQAVSLSPESSLVQVAYADYLSFRSRYDEAEQQLRQALEKNPNDSEAIAVQAVNLSLQGKAEAALEKAELALLLDPYHAWARWIKAEAQFFSGSFEDCLATIASTGNAPGFIQIYNIAANIKLNRLQGAQKALADFLQFCRQNMLSMPRTIPQWLEYYRDNAPFTDPAYNQEIIDCMLQAGLRETSSAKDRSTDEEALPAILVLPFSNLSGDPEQEYFSDGISDSIIVSLSSFAALNVKSRHTSVVYRDSSHSIEEIGAELGVRYVVEGSIRKLGDNVRITVQLGDTLSGNQVWGKRYDSALENLFELEEELVQTIAGTVSGRIEHASQASSLRKPASDMRSYDYLMRGSYHLEKFTARDTAIGIEQFQKCLDIDADNAQAHNALAVSYAVELFENWCADRKAAEAKAYSHIQKALLLAPQDAHVHATMAEHQLFTRDFDLGLFHARRAIELNPTMPDGYGVMAYLLAVSGDIDAALDAADTSMQIDPHHYYMGWNAGEVYRMAGQYQRALDAFRSIPHLSPSVRAQSAACFAALGQLDQAKAQMQHYHRLAHEQMPAYPQSVADWHHYWYSITPYPQDEDFKFFFEQLKQAGLCDEIDQAQTEVPSIAVLPFENMSVDPEQAFFSDGITTDIIATLSKFQHMRVIARHSILQYKNHKASITDIAGEQSVRYILEGSVRKSAEKIRVNAELIDVLSEQNIWSERYDRDLDDIFAVQDDITRNITVALKVALTDGERSASRTIGTGNVKAWELVLLATDLQDSYIQQNVIDARKMILQAIELDPNYAYARVALGWTHWQEAYSDWTDSLEHSLADAADAVEQSLQLEPDNAEAWILASTIHITRHESEKAVTASNRALELEPGNAEIQALAGFAMNFIGDYEKATEHFHKALSLCPFCPNWYYLVGAQPHRDTGNLEKAAELLRRGITAEPDSPLCRFYLADVLLEQGNETEAQQIAAEIRKLDSSMNGRGLTRSHSNDASKRDRFLQNLEKLGLA